jgi:hypothetical protein
MKSLALLLLLPATLGASFPIPRPVVTTGQIRLGFDSNPRGSAGSTQAAWGDTSSLTCTLGAGFNLLPTDRPLKLGYQGEWTGFEGQPQEDFSTHRLTLGLQRTVGGWKFQTEGSSLLIAGGTDTLPALSTANANAVSLWRDRRRQWQHRFRLQAQTETATRVLRAMGTLLAVDYRTDVVPGKVAFADRADALAGLDVGWKGPAASLWFAGLRAGRQTQAVVPLPDCNFDYSSNYQRVVLGWEGRLPAGATLAFAAGPDFRHFTGAIDPVAFSPDRDRSSLWFEGSLTARPHPQWALAAKAGRFSWLSSTGKSAYLDSSAEVSATWSPGSEWSIRAGAKVHRCDYLPARRDDWESLWSAAATRSLSNRTRLTLEIVRHRAWNGLPAATERQFRRLLVQFGTTITM